MKKEVLKEKLLKIENKNSVVGQITFMPIFEDIHVLIKIIELNTMKETLEAVLNEVHSNEVIKQCINECSNELKVLEGK